MHVVLNCELLDEVDCFKYLESEVAVDGGCERDVVHRKNEWYLAWGTLKSALSNRGFRMKDGGGCEKPLRVESPGSYVTE